MLKPMKYEFTLYVGTPSGECARPLFHILFSIMTPTQSKQFHNLAGKIFIGMVLFVLIIVEKINHCRTFAHGKKKVRKVSECISADHIKEQLLIKYIQVTRSKMTM